MFNFLKKNKPVKKSQDSLYMARYFYSFEQHNWILENKYHRRVFDLFLSNLNEKELYFLKENPVIFLPSSGTWCSAIHKTNMHVVTVFPDMLKLFRSANPEVAVAILLHEFAHLLYGHGVSDITSIDAQLEADYFACIKGYKRELITFLSDYENDSHEAKIRISHIKSLA